MCPTHAMYPSSQADEAHVLEMCLRRRVGLFVRLFVSSVATDDGTETGSWERHGDDGNGGESKIYKYRRLRLRLI